MSAALQMRRMEYIVFEVRLLDGRTENAGVILLDREADRLHVQVREDLPSFAPEGEVDAFLDVKGMLEGMARDNGAATALALFESSFDGRLNATDRQATMAADPEARLRRLFREHVAPADTVPIYKLRAAAGGLSDEADLPGESIGSIGLPPSIRTAPGMFAFIVTGRSMEPAIPDGSPCLIRPHRGGSRNGQILLIEKFGFVDTTSQFTLKEYRSEKCVNEDGTWEHARIRMVPLNPEFEEWDLAPEEFRVIGEFVAVLPPEE
jgi:phage repressor protein C with HTH and peptisase S24 domain